MVAMILRLISQVGDTVYCAVNQFNWYGKLNIFWCKQWHKHSSNYINTSHCETNGSFPTETQES